MAEHKDEKSFEVRYQYYQYNDGLANNGNKSGKEEFNTVESAQQFIDKINKSINNKLSDKEDKEFIREYIESSCGGYFQGKPQLYMVTKTRLSI